MEVLEFTCTKEDFVDAQRLHHTLSLKGRRFLVMVGLVASGLVLLFAVLPPDHKAGLESGLLGAAIFVSVMTLSILMNRLVYLPRAGGRQFSQQKEFSAALQFEIDPPRIGITSKNGFANVPTEDLLKWAENGKVILLYRSDRMFNFIPRRCVTDAFHAALMAELARAGVPRAGFSNS